MRRRRVLGILAGMTAWPCVVSAQTTVPVVGFLSPQADSVGYSTALHAGLRQLGYVDGRNIRIESRWAQGRFDQLPQMAADLVGLNVDVLVASLTQASLAAKKATAKIPIVMAGVGDPVAVGLVGSLARPGGNITGTSSDIVGKQLELLKEVVPGVSRVAVLWNPANAAFQALQLGQAEQAARVVGFELQLLEVRTSDEIDTAFANIKNDTRALAVLGDPLFALHSVTIAELALKNRLVTVSSGREFSNAGILMTYGASLFDSHKRAALYVDKILKGAMPADLPVEQPTTFEMVINLKTAKALGLAIPPSLLARASEVIE
jgi:putative tryptophan/tyrosine transport system substrate-binding protein